MKRETILYSKISAAVIAIVLSLALLSPFSYALGIEYFPLMCDAVCSPRPDAPSITYGEFPFIVTYEVNGEILTREDIIICEYTGVEWSSAEMDTYRTWDSRFLSDEYIVLYEVDEETKIVLDTGCYPASLMGDTEISSAQNKACACVLTYLSNGAAFCHHEDDEIIYQTYGVRVIDFEITPPIENTFISKSGSCAACNTLMPAKSGANRIEYSFDIFAGEATVVGYSGEASAIEIPAKVRGVDVVAVADDAFTQCYNLVSVTIPDSVTEIGESAFERCHRLESITLPDSVTSIGKSAFAYCTNLESVELPANLTVIEEMTFCDCRNLTEVTLPDNLESIGRRAFMNCKSLEELYVPDSVTAIGVNAFKGCTVNLYLPELPGFYGYQIDPGINLEVR